MKNAAEWVAGSVSPSEELDRGRLGTLATELGREEALWRHLVRHIPDERYFVELFRDSHLDVWLICWLNGQDTGFHDHDVSFGAVYVADGLLAEDRFQYDRAQLRVSTREHPAGAVFEFDASYVHRMRHTGGGPAVSIHCYSPALWRMGHYDVDDEGALCRTSITYADEMWTGRLVGGRSFAP